MSRQQVAKANRQRGFKYNRPQIANAGSLALIAPAFLARTLSQPVQASKVAKAVDPATRRRSVRIEVFIQSLHISKGRPEQWHYGEPDSHFTWCDSISQYEFQHQCTSLLDWFISHCEAQSTINLLYDNDYLQHFFIGAWQTKTTNYPVKLRIPPNETSLDNVLDLFVTKKERNVLKINVLHAKDSSTKTRFKAHHSISSTSASSNTSRNTQPLARTKSPSVPLAIRPASLTLASVTASGNSGDIVETTETSDVNRGFKVEKPSWTKRVCTCICSNCTNSNGL